jgi:outer membrane protein assembly factor BamB
MNFIKHTFTLIFFFLTIYQLHSQEVIQWRGEQRDGKYNETNLLKEWPQNGPELLWHFDELGEGHASVAVSNDRIYTAGTENGNGFVIALNHDGNKIWKTEYGKEFMESWPGVRSTPNIYGDNLYILSAYGRLVCMNKNNGSIIWTVNIFTDYDGRNTKWGVTENLVIHENKIYVTVGGTDANVIALNKDNGTLIWKSKGNQEKSAYCSPTVINHNGFHIFVTQTESSIMGFDANSGEFLWHHFQPNQYYVHANTPLYKDGQLLIVSGYGKGSVMLQLSDDGKSISELWRNKTLDNRMGGVILLNNKIYGSGDYNRGWYCVDWNTGKDLSNSELFTKGTIIYADNMLYCYSEGGEVALVKPENNQMKMVSKFKVPYGEKQHWAHLVIHNKKLYVRHGSSLMVYSIANS